MNRRDFSWATGVHVGSLWLEELDTHRSTASLCQQLAAKASFTGVLYASLQLALVSVNSACFACQEKGTICWWSHLWMIEGNKFSVAKELAGVDVMLKVNLQESDMNCVQTCHNLSGKGGIGWCTVSGFLGASSSPCALYCFCIFLVFLKEKRHS